MRSKVALFTSLPGQTVANGQWTRNMVLSDHVSGGKNALIHECGYKSLHKKRHVDLTSQPFHEDPTHKKNKQPKGLSDPTSSHPVSLPFPIHRSVSLAERQALKVSK